MFSGRIERLVSLKGFGFIRANPSTGFGDVFFHATAVANRPFSDLIVGEKVQFEVAMTPKGTRAENVVVL